MSKEILVPLIAATAAILSAVIAIISAIKVATINRKTQRSIEILKFELQEKIERNKCEKSAIKEHIDLIKRAISAIQRARDLIHKITGPGARFETLPEISDEFDSTVNDFMSIYEYMCVFEEESHILEAHKVKNALVMTSNIINKYSNKAGRAHTIDDKYRTLLMELRSSLRGAQNVFREKHLNYLEDYMS